MKFGMPLAMTRNDLRNEAVKSPAAKKQIIRKTAALWMSRDDLPDTEDVHTKSSKRNFFPA